MQNRGMKSFIISILTIMSFSDSYCQYQDYTWMLGDKDIPIVDKNSGFGIFQFNFNYDPPRIIFDEKLNSTESFLFQHQLTSLSMCDSMGKLLFFFQGTRLFNADGTIMEGGENLNNLDATGNSNQEFICVPYPGQNKKYILI